MTETSFDRLHPEVRRWIRDEGWSELRPVQDQAIRTILGSDRDVVIAAATAARLADGGIAPTRAPAHLAEVMTDAARLEGALLASEEGVGLGVAPVVLLHAPGGHEVFVEHGAHQDLPVLVPPVPILSG